MNAWGERMQIKSNIPEIMKKKKMTILRLAMEAGIATETIARARDERIGKCRLETLLLIARVLDVPVKSLFEQAE